MKWPAILGVSLLTGSAVMADEAKLAGKDILALLSDQTLVGAEEDSKIEQIFQTGGLTIYTDNGAQSLGQWKVENSQYCSVWPPGSYWTCYDVTLDGEIVTFLSKGGNRFAMRMKR